MPEQQQKKPSKSTDAPEEIVDVDHDAEVAAARKEKLDDDVDSILDEIDDVLEENAEEFVRSFVQKGGE